MDIRRRMCKVVILGSVPNARERGSKLLVRAAYIARSAETPLCGEWGYGPRCAAGRVPRARSRLGPHER
eukprot:scaffold7998_cov417-Prasinococcus_capsulatus_cf.AAC.17